CRFVSSLAIHSCDLRWGDTERMRHRDTEAQRILGFLCVSAPLWPIASVPGGPCRLSPRPAGQEGTILASGRREPFDCAWAPVPLTECSMDAIAKIGPSIRIKGD